MSFLRPPPGATNPAGVRHRRVQLLQSPLDRDAGEAAGPADAADPAEAERSGLGGGEEATLPLVEAGEECDELTFQLLVGVHNSIIGSDGQL